MPEPEYVKIAHYYERRIRSGEMSATTRFPSYSEMVHQHGVSDIVVRQAIEQLRRQGLVRTVARKGTYVVDHPNRRRVSPERQMESAETTFGNESTGAVQVHRSIEVVPAPAGVAEELSIPAGNDVSYIVTRASEDGRPISISDTYQPVGAPDVATAKFLEETVSDRLPTSTHGEWLKTSSTELVKVVHQRFTTDDGRVIMVSDISYPRDRYESFVFRMSLDPAVSESDRT